MVSIDQLLDKAGFEQLIVVPLTAFPKIEDVVLG
jgi:hypothetical protein